MRRNGGGNATSTANRPSASEGGPARTLTTARRSSVSNGPGFAAASGKKTSRRLIDTPRASREALATYYRKRKHEIQRGSPVRQPRGRRAGIARAGERDGSRSCRSTVGRRHQQIIPGGRR